MKTVYVFQPFPRTFHKSLYLAGPTPRDPTVPSWRPQALHLLESVAYDGVVFVPESQEGQRSDVYEQHMDWELEAMRRAEGESLARDLGSGIGDAAAALERLGVLSEAGKAERRSALCLRLRELTGELGLDDARLYQEVVRQVERGDVSEELQRLRSHLRQFRELLESQEPAGKRLDFLTQELMREANTLGSKSPSATLVLEVVALKDRIERLREQVQNVE